MWQHTFFVALFAFTLSSSDDSSVPNSCKNIPKDQWYSYDETQIASIAGVATDIAKSFKTGNIYYILNSPDPDRYDMDLYTISSNNNVPRRLLENVQTVAVDNVNNTIYVGFDGGIKIYSELTGEFESISNITDDVWQLFIAEGKSELYAVNYNRSVVKYDTINSEGVELPFVSPRGMNIAVDEDGNVFTLNEELIPEVLLKGYSKSLQYLGIESNSTNFLAVGFNNKVFAGNEERLFVLPTDSTIPKLIASLDFVPSSLVIDDAGILTFGTYNSTLVTLTFRHLDCINDILG